MTRTDKLKEIVNYANMLIQDNREDFLYLFNRLGEHSIVIERGLYDNLGITLMKVHELKVVNKVDGLDKFINSIIKEKKEYEKTRIDRKLSKVHCPICGKLLIRLEPYEKGRYSFWCDDCVLDIDITDINNHVDKTEKIINGLKKGECI